MDKDDDSVMRLMGTFFDDIPTEDEGRTSDGEASFSFEEGPPSKKTAVAARKTLHPPMSFTPEIFTRELPSPAVPAAISTSSFLDLPDALLGHCASFLSAPEVLLKLAPLNERLCQVARHDGAGWKERVDWLERSHQFLSFDPSRSSCWLDTYRSAWWDLRRRQFIRINELCYDVSGTVFQFRFKAAAGSDWTEQDPWYTRGEARRIVFLRDGTCRQLLADGKLSEVAPNQTYTWRWVARPMDFPRRSENTGHYVRLSISGRDVPTYSIRRSETGNGGFVMESCWGLFCSFDMTNELQERLTNEIQWREAFLYNVGSATLPEGEEAAEQFDRVWRG